MSVSFRKVSFEFECWRCGMRAVVPLPRVLCDECRQVYAEAAAKATEEAWFVLARDYGIMRGDRVRLKTPAEKEFERAVLTDLRRLP